MNYIKELNAFYDCVEREPLSASAVSLWNTLLHINNKTAWADEFSVAGTVLKLKGGLADSSFKRARKELEERGFIEFRSRGTRMAPIYKMKRLHLEFGYVNSVGTGQGDGLIEEPIAHQVDKCVQMADQNSTQYDDQEQLNAKLNQSMNLMSNHKVDHNMNQMTAPLNKVNNTKQNEIKQYATPRATAQGDEVSDKTERKGKLDAIVFYQENFGKVSPFLAGEILSWVNDIGDELIIEGMKRALERGKFNFGYIKSILKSWVKQGISSVEMLRVKELEREHRSVHKQYRPGGDTLNKEIVPDWFWERKRKEKGKQEVVDEVEESDVGKLLKEYLAQKSV